jgi:uncharacterized membrane protein
MSNSCAQWRGEIGAYVVGALDRSARDRVTRHLAACARCRADYDDLVPVRRLLGLLAVPADGPEPHQAQGTDKLPAIRPRTRRRLSAAGAVLAAAAAAAAVAALVSSGASARTFRAADSATGVSGHAQLHGTPTGTQIDLTASGLPGHERCILIAVTHHGIDIAGSWAATYDGSARIAGTTAFSANRLIALRIESDTGVVLLSIPV